MSYVPATTVKNGVTLKLADVEWQVTGTDLVGEVLTPSSFQAIATYTGKANMMNGKMGAMGVGLAKGLNASGEEAWYCVQLFLYDGQTVTWVDEPVLN